MKKSAGILVYRIRNKKLLLFLVHPGGPFWKNKDHGAWSIPKGEFDEAEDGLTAAKREFEEETGQQVDGKFIALGSAKLKSGKTIFAWAVKADVDAAAVRSNLFPLEWPPKSGKKIMVPEVDKGEWFEPDAAREKINAAQVVFIDRLLEIEGFDGE